MPDLSNVRVVGLRNKREIITLPPLEKTVLVNGREVIKQIPLQTVFIEPGGYHVPRSKNELEALKASNMHGKIYRVVEQSVEDAGEPSPVENVPNAHAGAPDSPENSGADDIDSALASVTTKAEAAEVLMNEPFAVEKAQLLSDAGNLTKANIEAAAERFGITFPNL